MNSEYRRNPEQTSPEIQDLLAKELQELKFGNYPKSKIFSIFKKYLPIILVGFSVGHEDRKPLVKIEVARTELKQKGITREQRKVYKPGVSELLYRQIDPFGYSAPERLKNLIPNLIYGRETEGGETTSPAYKKIIQSREDAWRMYLGMPQKYNTFSISSYRPSKSKEEKYYYNINNFWDKCRKNFSSDEEMVKFLLKVAQGRGEKIDDDAGVMGHYKISTGQDNKGSYISYYDLWNLEGSKEGSSGLLGKPFEIYDRVYYEPTTYKVLLTEK